MENEDVTRYLTMSISELLPVLKKKIVILGSKNPEDVTPFFRKKIEELFFRGIMVDELIEIETEIEDIILNDKYGLHSQNTKSDRDHYREDKLRKKGTRENKFDNKLSSVILVFPKYLTDLEKKELILLIQKITNYRHFFAHKECKYNLENNAFLYFDGEKSTPINLEFIKQLLKETLRIKEILMKIKKGQENGK